MNKKELIRTLYSEYANKNETIGFMIVTAVDNDVSETVLRDILRAEAPIKEKTAKIFANIMGVDYKEICTFNDIKENFRAKEFERIKELTCSKTEIEEIVKTSIKENLEQLKETSIRQSEDIKMSNEKLSEALKGLLAISENTLEVNKTISALKTEIEKLSAKKEESLNDVIIEDIAFIKENIQSQSPKKKWGIFSREDSENNDVLDEQLEEKTESENKFDFPIVSKSEDISVKKEKFDKYIRTHKLTEGNVDVHEIFNLISLGIYDDKQVDALNKAMMKELSINQLVELANPDNNSKTMFQLIDFFESVNKKEKAEADKKRRQEAIRRRLKPTEEGGENNGK